MQKLIDFNCWTIDGGIDPGTFVHTADFAIPAKDEAVRSISAASTFDIRFALTPPLYYSTQAGAADNRQINDVMLGAAREWNARAFGVVEPKFGEAARQEIGRLAQAGAAGAVFSPRAQGLFANDGQMVDIFGQCHALGLIPMIHTAPYSINESLYRVWDLAAQCGDGPFVILGGCRSWENVQAILRAGREQGNIYYDTSGLSSSRDLDGLVQACGADRLLFASGGWRMLDETLHYVQACSFGDEARDAILYGNAARLLGMEG